MNGNEVKSRIERLRAQLVELGLTSEQAAAVLEGRDASRLPSEPELALVAFDADSVQSQIFVSPRPVTISGASRLLQSWDLRLGSGEVLGTRAVVLFAGGGQATLLVRRVDAPEIEETLTREFVAHTAGAPCTVVFLAISCRALAEGPSRAIHAPPLPSTLAQRIAWSPKGGGGFGACMAWLSFLLRQRKGEAGHAPVEEATMAARCAECAERPREQQGERCARCAHNRRAGQRGKRSFDEARDLEEVVGEPTGAGSAALEDDKARQRARQLAFIKLDGRGVGAVLEKLHTMAQYAAVSWTLQRAFELDPATRDDELQRLGVPAGRYQLPIAGGDDLLIVVPGRFRRPDGEAGDALTLAAALAARVEHAFDASPMDGCFAQDQELLRQVRRMGAGVGVVLTSGLPARFCFEYASELVRSAKDAIGPVEGPRSAVDFVVLRGGSPLSSSIRSLREAETAPVAMQLGPHRIGGLRRTRCPYPLPDYQRMLARARELTRVSRSALHELRGAMREPEVGLLAIRYQMVRDRELRGALIGDVPLASVPPQISEWVLAPAGQGQGAAVWATAIPDLLEATRFVGTGPTSEEEV